MDTTTKKKNITVLLDLPDWEMFNDYAWNNRYPKAQLARKWIMERLDVERARIAEKETAQ